MLLVENGRERKVISKVFSLYWILFIKESQEINNHTRPYPASLLGMLSRESTEKIKLDDWRYDGQSALQANCPSVKFAKLNLIETSAARYVL